LLRSVKFTFLNILKTFYFFPPWGDVNEKKVIFTNCE
jgi:hypothetical protein